MINPIADILANSSRFDTTSLMPIPNPLSIDFTIPYPSKPGKGSRLTRAIKILTPKKVIMLYWKKLWTLLSKWNRNIIFYINPAEIAVARFANTPESPNKIFCITLVLLVLALLLKVTLFPHIKPNRIPANILSKEICTKGLGVFLREFLYSFLPSLMAI